MRDGRQSAADHRPTEAHGDAEMLAVAFADFGGMIEEQSSKHRHVSLALEWMIAFITGIAARPLGGYRGF